MKSIKILAIGTLVLALIGIAIGGSFYVTGTNSEYNRPAKTYSDYMMVGNQYLDDGEYYKAIVSFENALTEKEDDVDSLMGLASAYSRQMRYEDETAIREKIAEIVPADLDNQVRLVELMINNGEFGAAKRRTEELLQSTDSKELRSLYNEMNIDAPVFNFSSGVYDDYLLLEMANVYSNAIVRYTLDGSEPTSSSPSYSDGIVISYPETVIRAKAFGALGYTSDETQLSFTITKPVEIIALSSRYYDGNNTIQRIASNILNRSSNSEIYNYEMAQIREIYVLGSYWVEDEPMSAAFFNGYYRMNDSRYSEYGDFTLDFVAYTPFLKTLTVGYQNNLDLSPLASLTRLENLSLLSDGISDISALREIKSLRQLALGWNQITDVSALSTLTSLESLGLWNNNISDISPLSDLTDLTYLDVAYNNIGQIEIVSKMKDLNEVWINDNHIQDISPLSACNKLMILMQNNNPIKDYSAIRDMSAQIYKSDIDWGGIQ